ncbi:unnamed protein product, partial [Musa acuminata subsp. burmannicoides]
MEPIDLVPSGYRFLPTAEELWLTTSPTGSPAHPPGRAVAFADVYGTEPWNLLGSDRQEGYFFAERKPRTAAARASIERPAAVLGLCTKSKKPLSPWSAGARWWSGERAAFLSTMAGGRTPGGRCTSSRCVRLAASRHEFSVTSREARIVPTRRHHHQNVGRLTTSNRGGA